MLPLPDVEGTLEQIAYAFDVLELDGVSMLTNAGGSYLGDDRFDDIFADLQRRAAVAFIHPTASPDPIAHTLGLPDALLDYPVDTSRAIAKLHYSNTFARTPDVKYVFAHAGGTIPFVASRFAIVDEMDVIPGSDRAPRVGPIPIPEIDGRAREHSSLTTTQRRRVLGGSAARLIPRLARVASAS